MPPSPEQAPRVAIVADGADPATGENPHEGALDHVRAHATIGDPDSVLRALDDYATHHQFLMNVGPDKGRVLVEALESAQARRVLELGAFVGYSAVLIARHLPPDGRLVSAEISPAHAGVTAEVLRLAGLADRVEIRLGTSARIIDELADEGAPLDLVFLDHTKDEYLPDLERIERSGLLHPGSVVVADNVGPLFDAGEYLAHVRDSGSYETTYHALTLEYRPDTEDGVEVSVWRGPGG